MCFPCSTKQVAGASRRSPHAAAGGCRRAPGIPSGNSLPSWHVQSRALCRFVSGAARGQWSNEIWLRDGYSVVTQADHEENIHSLSPQNVAVLHADPRRLILRLVSGTFCALLASLHGPHRAVEGSTLDAWWIETQRLLRRFAGSDVLLAAGDMNAALGSIVTDSVGSLAAEPEDTVGRWIQEITQEHRLWLPSTFSSTHQGATHTYVQKKSFKLIRPDFIFLPWEWGRRSIRSWTAPQVHAGHVVQDHVAAIADVHLLLPAAASKARTRIPRIDVADVLDPANSSHIQQLFANAPKVPWSVSAHAHAVRITQHIQAGLAALRSRRSTRPRHAYLSDATFELQQAAALVRRELHGRQHAPRKQCLAACWAVWRGQAPSFLEGFLDNGCVKQLRGDSHCKRPTAKCLRAGCS